MGWRANETFPVIRELLRERFPTSTVIPYEAFPKIHLSPLRAKPKDAVPLEGVGEELKKKGCDAVILGNGG